VVSLKAPADAGRSMTCWGFRLCARNEIRASGLEWNGFIHCARLQHSEPQRTGVQFDRPQLCVRGDATCSRIALENLLGNAWKFTSKKPGLISSVGRRKRRFIFLSGVGAVLTWLMPSLPCRRLHANNEFPARGSGWQSSALRRHGESVRRANAVKARLLFRPLKTNDAITPPRLNRAQIS
jgi:hypothetical protein